MVQDMKKLASVSSRKLPKMNKSTIIRKSKKRAAKHSILKKVVSYLITDSYMYNPLVSPQPWFDLPPPKQMFAPLGFQEDVALPIKGRNKNLIDKFVDYLKADCYMYAPLINNNQHEYSKSHVTNKDSGGEMQKGGDELSRQVGAGRVVNKSVAYRETVKRVVH